MPLPRTIKSERLYHGSIIDLIIEDVEDTPGNIRKREIVSHPPRSTIGNPTANITKRCLTILLMRIGA